ncbi:MAG: hypothetical protein PPHEMADMSA_4909 [uncultured Paraburkholderia sp.]|nr:MAG: hypothetical protein PPHEMADMSA_4909 [uncultured Paraburkholderia sp.]
MTGGHVDREHALVQSCGRFFEPARLQLDPLTGASTGQPHMRRLGCAICTR